MAKIKHRKRANTPSPLKIAAEQSLPPEARQHAAFIARRFQERGLDQGVMDGMRMEKIACVRSLEGLARRHPKSRSAFLDPIQLMAANAYHADLQDVRGQRSHAVRESIDVSSDVEATLLYRVEARQKLTRIQNRMPQELKSVLEEILVKFPDSTLVSIWPNRSQRDKSKASIKAALDWLAVEYGLVNAPSSR